MIGSKLTRVFSSCTNHCVPRGGAHFSTVLVVVKHYTSRSGGFSGTAFTYRAAVAFVLKYYISRSGGLVGTTYYVSRRGGPSTETLYIALWQPVCTAYYTSRRSSRGYTNTMYRTAVAS